MVRIILLFLFIPLASFAKEKELLTTKERAKNMFRSPSGEVQKINPKFQPIDHKIKTTEPKAPVKTQK